MKRSDGAKAWATVLSELGEVKVSVEWDLRFARNSSCCGGRVVVVSAGEPRVVGCCAGGDHRGGGVLVAAAWASAALDPDRRH